MTGSKVQILRRPPRKPQQEINGLIPSTPTIKLAINISLFFMTFLTHVAVGSAVGLATKNPYLGFAAGVVSHHIIDVIPHSDPGSLGISAKDILKKENRGGLVWAVSDAIVGAGLFIFILLKFNFESAVLWGMIGAVLPDLIDNSPFWSLPLRQFFPFNYYHRFHEKFHFTISAKRYFWLGFLTQIVLICLSLAFVFSA